jgi:hypothetical protein
MACTVEIDNSIYTHPEEDFKKWSKSKLEVTTEFINKKLASYDIPTVIVLEIAHFMLPRDEKNFDWADKNLTFANDLCKNIIQKHKHKFKIIPTILVNNLEEDQNTQSQQIIDDLLKNKKYINHKSLKTISERNLKNRAFKALKNDSSLTDQFINIDGKAYLKDDEHKHDLAAGFVNEDGDIIPRCGLILTSYLDYISKLATQRLHQNKDINILFISFSQEFHEYKRVMLGVDIYSKMHKSLSIDPMIFHWAYEKDRSLLSYKSCESGKWEETLL